MKGLNAFKEVLKIAPENSSHYETALKGMQRAERFLNQSRRNDSSSRSTYSSQGRGRNGRSYHRRPPQRVENPSAPYASRQRELNDRERMREHDYTSKYEDRRAFSRDKEEREYGHNQKRNLSNNCSRNRSRGDKALLKEKAKMCSFFL